MHIPDGYLSPATSIPLIGAMIPIWAVAMNKLKKALKIRQVPLLSIGAAFSFTIMMFNVPVLGGSSVHAVGAVLLAILLGPWAACIGVSIALFIQAFLFNDGGIWAIGANCFNMAFVMPFTGYYIYKLIDSKSTSPKRRMIAAFFAGFIGLNAAALLTSVEFGIQPLLFINSDGTPAYCPFPLWVSVPAMMVGHLLIAGPIEGIVTMLALSFVSKMSPELLQNKRVLLDKSRIKQGGDANEKK